DAEGRRRRIPATRSRRSWGAGEGAGHLRLRDNPEVVAELMAAVGPVAARLFNEARRAGRREPPEAYRADALLELVRDKTTSATTNAKPWSWAKVIVRVDLLALVRGYPLDG